VPWTDEHHFDEPFVDLRGREDLAAPLLAELLREVGPGHVLHERALAVVAKALPQDDIVVTFDSEVALVHLTWKQDAETPPWPTTETCDSAEALNALVEFRY